MNNAPSTHSGFDAQRAARRRHQLNRALVYSVGILISLWILIPIFLIASMAFTTPEEVRSYPRNVLPFIPFSLATMRFFLNSEGILPGVINSVIRGSDHAAALDSDCCASGICNLVCISFRAGIFSGYRFWQCVPFQS